MLIKALGVTLIIVGALVITLTLWCSLSDEQMQMIEEGSEA